MLHISPGLRTEECTKNSAHCVWLPPMQSAGEREGRLALLRLTVAPPLSASGGQLNDADQLNVAEYCILRTTPLKKFLGTRICSYYCEFVKYRVLRDNIKGVNFCDTTSKICNIYIRSNLNTTMLKSSQIWNAL